LKRRRASAYAQNEPMTIASAVVVMDTMALLSSDLVKSPFWKIDW
jgi:hypothetical protein